MKHVNVLVLNRSDLKYEARDIAPEFLKIQHFDIKLGVAAHENMILFQDDYGDKDGYSAISVVNILKNRWNRQGHYTKQIEGVQKW